jgi:endonuclease-3
MQKESATQPAKPSRRRKVRTQDVMDYLGAQYGPVQWHVRYTPAEELVYTILSQHTSDLNSERAFKSLIATFETLDAVADASVDSIEEAIRRGGLAKQKAPRIKNVLCQIRDEIGSFDLSFLAEMPLDEAKAWLKRLNGIGPKTAAIILCFSLGMPAMPVDTHIFRVSRRLGLIGPKVNADKAHDILEPLVAPEDVFAFHMYLIQHGRQVCKAQRPLCDECALAWGCRERPKIEREALRAQRKRSRKSK